MTSMNHLSRGESRRKLHRSSGVFNILPHSPQVHYPEDSLPLESEENMERLEAMAGAVSELEKNMSNMAEMHAAVNSRFNEPFAAFLYGLLMTMFCNNLPGCPTQAAFKSINRIQEAQSRIQDLQKRVQAARSVNKVLQQEVGAKTLEQKTMAIRNEAFARKTPMRKPQHPVRPMVAPARERKVHVSYDDTFSTTDSFIETPAATGKKPALPRAGGRPGTSSGTTLGAGGPNLDQPPRYMRGLFDKTNTANIRKTASKPSRPARKIGRLASRPPFR